MAFRGAPRWHAGAVFHPADREQGNGRRSRRRGGGCGGGGNAVVHLVARVWLYSVSLTQQKVEVGIVFQDMLGTADALQYFVSNCVAIEVALRVLLLPGLRRNASGCW